MSTSKNKSTLNPSKQIGLIIYKIKPIIKECLGLMAEYYFYFDLRET